MHRVSLSNTAYEGDNNAYLFDDEDTVLIDTGIATTETRRQLQVRLAAFDVEFSDIDRIYLTHFHADHSGLAGEIQQASGAQVFVHPDDAPLVAGDTGAKEALRQQQHRQLNTWGVPQGKLEELFSYMADRPSRYGQKVDVTPLEDSDRFDVGGTEFEVMRTSGHTRGHLSFVDTAENVVFTGDALLPKYTPNVGGADVRVERPLEKYLETLNIFTQRDFGLAWSGHRGPIEDPTGRASEIIDHHWERAFRVLELLSREGPLTAWEVSAHLFGGLERIHILHGPGEAFAHLEHLSRTGALEYDDGRYRLMPGAKNRLVALDEDRWPL